MENAQSGRNARRVIAVLFVLAMALMVVGSAFAQAPTPDAAALTTAIEGSSLHPNSSIPWMVPLLGALVPFVVLFIGWKYGFRFASGAKKLS